jgi:hypothetical protein
MKGKKSTGERSELKSIFKLHLVVQGQTNRYHRKETQAEEERVNGFGCVDIFSLKFGNVCDHRHLGWVPSLLPHPSSHRI